MRGFARPTGILIPQQTNGYDPALDTRLPVDLGVATALLKQAGYPEGFEVGMDCPNDRYVNDEAICQAVTSMLARIGVRIKLNVQPRAKFFAKVNAPRFETSLVLMGWSPASGDAHNVLINVMASRDLPRGRGQFNHSGYASPQVDALADAVLSETDPEKRSRLIAEAVSIHKREIGHIPLHQQMILWAARSGIDLVMQPNAAFPLHFVKLP
jgi:peptide/nickel transport system substrate-binding protein